jgi:hypothetical protein
VKYTGRKTHTGNKLYAVYGHLKRR